MVLILTPIKQLQRLRQELDYTFSFFFSSKLLVVTTKDKIKDINPMPKYTPKTGLVGGLEIGEDYLNCTVLLSPTLTIKQEILVDPISTQTNSGAVHNNPNRFQQDSGKKYIIHSLSHKGSFCEDQWHTRLTLVKSSGN